MISGHDNVCVSTGNRAHELPLISARPIPHRSQQSEVQRNLGPAKGRHRKQWGARVDWRSCNTQAEQEIDVVSILSTEVYTKVGNGMFSPLPSLGVIVSTIVLRRHLLGQRTALQAVRGVYAWLG